MKKVSLIVPFYNEQGHIKFFFETINKVMATLPYEFEIICVDDGSRDLTLEELKTYGGKKARILSFSRNFGKEIALSAGLDYASGNIVIPLDADLQDPPALIPKLIAEWEKGFDVVLAVREGRNDGFLKNFTAKLFYNLINKISETPIYKNVGDFRLMDRKVVDVLKRMPERNRFMKGLLSWPGFKITEVKFKRPKAEREAKQNYNKLFNLAFDGIISYSDAPLKFIVVLGFFITLMSFVFAIYRFIRVLLYGIDLPGYNSTLIVLLLLGGIIILSIGIVGIYISKIFNEVKQRPLYVLKENIAGIDQTEQRI